MYMVLYMSVCELSDVGVLLFQPGCIADTTFDCKTMINVITSLAPRLNMIKYQNVKHMTTLV